MVARAQKQAFARYATVSQISPTASPASNGIRTAATIVGCAGYTR